ncbi:hypothetical protein [Streptomyces sp. NPDC002602]|uniref:hypothetical protein n=1 Tax=Streptomyces sp. NPDC002602 TaxID=3364654 RepID=UPI0036B1D2C3
MRNPRVRSACSPGTGPSTSAPLSSRCSSALASAALIGLCAHHWLATPIRAVAYTGEHDDTADMLHVALVGAGLMAVLVWLWGAGAAARLAHAWRPSAD